MTRRDVYVYPCQAVMRSGPEIVTDDGVFGLRLAVLFVWQMKLQHLMITDSGLVTDTLHSLLSTPLSACQDA